MGQFKIRMKESDFYKISSSLNAKDVNISKGYIEFNTGKDGIKIITENALDYETLDTRIKKAKREFNIAKPFIIGLLTFIAVLYINTYRVQKISFNIETPINSIIENEIESKCRKLFVWDFIALDYSEYSKNIRTKYSNYPWINVSKNGSTVNVDIYKYDDEFVKTSVDPNGNIVASKDGIINEFYVYQGVSNLKKNQYVKKGDVLIASNLLEYTEREETVYTSAKGLILANTYESITITVPKQINNETLSGNKDKFYQLCFGEKSYNFEKKNDYLKYDEIVNNEFSLFGFINLKKIEQYEKCDIITTYTRDEAYEYALTTIENDFNTNKVSDYETLVSTILLEEIEEDKDFSFTFLVKKNESIGEFNPL